MRSWIGELALSYGTYGAQVMDLLPEPLQDENPRGIWPLVDGKFIKDELWT